MIPFTWFEINVRTNHGSSKFDEINGERVDNNKMKRVGLVRPNIIGNYEVGNYENSWYTYILDFLSLSI